MYSHNPTQQHAYGQATEAKGDIKSSIGNLTGSPGLVAEGHVDQAFGAAHQQAAAAGIPAGQLDPQLAQQQAATGSYLGGVKDQVVGAAKQTVGKLTGNEEQRMKGAVQSEMGKIVKEKNRNQ